MKTAAVKSSSNSPRGRGNAGGRGGGLEPAQIAAVARLFGVLSEESRLLILQSLRSGPASVGELVDRLGLKQANVSKQLGILLTAGVVARRQEGNRAIFSIAMPLVNDLCHLVCRGVREQAMARAEELG